MTHKKIVSSKVSFFTTFIFLLLMMLCLDIFTVDPLDDEEIKKKVSSLKSFFFILWHGVIYIHIQHSKQPKIVGA